MNYRTEALTCVVTRLEGVAVSLQTKPNPKRETPRDRNEDRFDAGGDKFVDKVGGVLQPRERLVIPRVARCRHLAFRGGWGKRAGSGAGFRPWGAERGRKKKMGVRRRLWILDWAG